MRCSSSVRVRCPSKSVHKSIGRGFAAISGRISPRPVHSYCIMSRTDDSGDVEHEKLLDLDPDEEETSDRSGEQDNIMASHG